MNLAESPRRLRNYRNQPYNIRLEGGKEFEVFAQEICREWGWNIGVYMDKEDQWEKGESESHTEIKLDTQWPDTGNLFIEIKERRAADGTSQWRAAGIYDASNPWLYLIGNYYRFWLFRCEDLRRLHRTGVYERKPRIQSPKDTSIGFVVPLADCERYCKRRWPECNYRIFYDPDPE